MESLGDQLREAREERGLSIEQVERETNILKNYLLALEMEDFSDFPGETYILGFIRNYAEFLGFDPDRLVQMYRNLVIQGQPVPLEELVTSSKKVNKKKLYLGLGVFGGVLALAGLIVLVTMLVINQKEQNALLLQSRKADIHEFNSTRQLFEVTLKDSIAMTEAVSGEDFMILFDGLDTKEGIAHFIVSGNKASESQGVKVEKQDFVLVDLNDDEINDIKLSFLDLLRGNRVSLEIDLAFIDTPRIMLKDPMFTDDFYKANPMETADAVIMSGSEMQPVQFKLAAKSKNWISYRADGATTIEKELNSNEPLALELRAGIIVWGANGNALAISVNDEVVALPELKDPSVAFILCWKQLPADGGYELGYYLLDK